LATLSAAETREQIVSFYRRACAHADETIGALTLDAVGHVPWWGNQGEVTLLRMLAHVIAETNRHAGHADIVREFIDGTAGLQPDNDNCRRPTRRGGNVHSPHPRRCGLA
jgi:hypothetical protein